MSSDVRRILLGCFSRQGGLGSEVIGRTMKNPGESKRWISSQAALVCGRAFQWLAEGFIPKISQMKFEPSEDMPEELGDLTACAANLGFAIELFLKALLSLLELPVPHTHDLHKLYGAVPEEVREILESTYDTALPGQLLELGGHASVTIASGPLQSPRWAEYASISQALPDLLERSKDIFSSWRYISEITQKVGFDFAFHEFEYALLWCAAESIRVEVTVRMDGET